MIHTFEDSELRLLIDGILASRHITASQRKDLISRVAKLGSSHFKPHGIDIESATGYLHRSQDLFLNIDPHRRSNTKGRENFLWLIANLTWINVYILILVQIIRNGSMYSNPFQLVMNRDIITCWESRKL